MILGYHDASYSNEEESPSIISKQTINDGWIFSNKAKESATETILVSDLKQKVKWLDGI